VYLCISDQEQTTILEVGKDIYKDPLIAMSVIACLLFLVLIIILVMWCKHRGKTEYKTVMVTPKSKKHGADKSKEFG